MKTLTAWGDTTLKNALEKGAKQGDKILIDARNVSATEMSIIRQINRAEGNIGNLSGRVEVWWSGGVIWR
ncbi:MAG: hypothetical protein KIT54_12025 [Phycisphaeraceae bacterium]|nr:hypothetical protein [Phycisphaeraceae bacterium]